MRERVEPGSQTAQWGLVDRGLGADGQGCPVCTHSQSR